MKMVKLGLMWVVVSTCLACGGSAETSNARQRAVDETLPKRAWLRASFVYFDWPNLPIEDAGGVPVVVELGGSCRFGGEGWSSPLCLGVAIGEGEPVTVLRSLPADRKLSTYQRASARFVLVRRETDKKNMVLKIEGRSIGEVLQAEDRSVLPKDWREHRSFTDSPIAWRRYDACVAEGFCPTRTHKPWPVHFDGPALGVTQAGAEMFCRSANRGEPQVLTQGFACANAQVQSEPLPPLDNGDVLDPERPREPLPAGVTWIDNRTEYIDCSDCATPKVALVAGIRKTAAAAMRLARSWQRRPQLTPGYPLLVHSDLLKPQPIRGVVVVLGLFDEVEHAQHWRKQKFPNAKALRVIGLTNPCFDTDDGTCQYHSVVRLSAAAAAFSADDIEAIGAQSGFRTQTGFEQLKKLKPICQLSKNDAFVVSSQELNHNLWSPARCGTTPVMVPKVDTLDDALIEQTGDGAFLRQVVEVECDSPTISVWHWSRLGRKPMDGVPYGGLNPLDAKVVSASACVH